MLDHLLRSCLPKLQLVILDYLDEMRREYDPTPDSTLRPLSQKPFLPRILLTEAEYLAAELLRENASAPYGSTVNDIAATIGNKANVYEVLVSLRQKGVAYRWQDVNGTYYRITDLGLTELYAGDLGSSKSPLDLGSIPDDWLER